MFLWDDQAASTAHKAARRAATGGQSNHQILYQYEAPCVMIYHKNQTQVNNGYHLVYPLAAFFYLSRIEWRDYVAIAAPP